VIVVVSIVLYLRYFPGLEVVNSDAERIADFLACAADETV
jgi:hypothetical protein